MIPWQCRGLPLGVVEDQSFQLAETEIEAGDVIVLYTDGIDESMNPRNELYGLDRFKESLFTWAGSGVPAMEWNELLLKDLETFREGEPRSDDITLITLEYDPA